MIQSTLKRLYQNFIKPPHPYDVATLHKSRLLSTFLLVMIFVFVLVDTVSLLTIPNYGVPWFGYAFLLTAYVLNRLPYYKASAGLVMIMFPVVVFATILNGDSASSGISLDYLILGVIVGGILLTQTGVIILAGIDILGILLMPYFAPQTIPSYSAIVSPLAILAIGTALVVISMRHRDQVERDRQLLLRQSEERYRMLFEEAPDGIMIVSHDNRILMANAVIYQLTGYAPEEVIGHSPNEFVAPEDAVRRPPRHISEIQVPGAMKRERVLVCKDQRRLTVIISSSYMPDGYLQFIIQDVTERKRIETEREDLIKELEAKNAELEQFTYTVSHDLKAPIITIKGFLGFLAEDASTGNLTRLEVDIHRISEAADKMHSLLNDLLELSRIGRLMNEPEPVDFRELVVEAEKILQSHLQKHGIHTLIIGDLPIIHGDRQRLLEVVQNLIDNAFKFLGDQPQPLIEVGQADAARDGFVTLFIRDNGIGIAPQFHERIFGLFNRLDPKVEGTGVGLALVKRIVDFHGGKIWVESEAGNGATFFFTLPQAK